LIIQGKSVSKLFLDNLGKIRFYFINNLCIARIQTSFF